MRPHAAPPPERPRALTRIAPWTKTPFGPDRNRFFGRWLGTLFVLGSVVAGVSLAFPDAPYANVPMAIVTSAIAFVIGVTLLAGAIDRVSFHWVRVVLFVGIVIASVGTYAGGAPTSGAEFFYIWLVPYAFAFSTLVDAGLLAAFVALCYGIVLLVQVRLNPGFGPSGLLVGMWMIVVATEVVVGLFVRRVCRSLRDVDQRFEHAFTGSPVGAAFVGTDLVWFEVNDALCKMLDRNKSELVGHRLLELTHAEDVANVREMLASSSHATLEFETRLLRPDQEIVWVTISAVLITPEVGEPYLFSQMRDITEHKADREILAHRAIHDPLTGLFNRALLLDRLSTAMRHGDARGRVAIILLDLDQFKVVNDSLGHHVGDQLLGAIAPRLLGAIESSDTLARFGGDEFVVLCEGLRHPIDAVDRADRLAAALSEPFRLSEANQIVHASIGVAVASDVSDDAASLLRDADAAMYRAKAAGRNRIEIFDRSMRDQAMARLALERDLRNALTNNELHVVYQPVVDSTTGYPVMFETLVRWNHPERGLLLPDVFIPLAEENGLIDEIGTFVLSESLRQLQAFQEALTTEPPIALNVNVSARQFEDKGFTRKVAELLRSHAIVPGSFGIELTESVLLDTTTPGDSLVALKDLGLLVLLDDFGTGYSSLSYLEQLPIDVLKVDKSFVARVLDEKGSTVVLEAILAMSKALGLRVIAEGVAEQDLIPALRELGCTLIQGNAVSEPLHANEVLAFIEERGAVACALGRDD